ncbi:SMP-30/gluconolactonase/LRE family protein [soil metagenome]
MTAKPAILTLALTAALATVLPAAEPGLSAIVDPDAQVSKLGGDMKFTEGPVWIPSQKSVVFSDIPNSVLMQWSEDGGLAELRKVEATNGNILDLDGNLVSCQHGGRNVVRWMDDGPPEVLAAKWENKKFNSPNDLAAHSDGSIWFTDPSYGLNDRQAEIDGKFVYRLDPSGEVTVVYRGFDMPNGIVFSPDESRVYISDTGQVGVVRAFDINEDNTLSETPVAELPIRCDGMCVDVDGNVYTTSAGGLHVFDAGGNKLGVIEIPEHPANVCFGGDDFKTLFVTARTGLYSVPAKIAGAKPKGSKW